MEPIGEEDMKAVLDRFYESGLRTPSAASKGGVQKVWKTASKGVPAERPEQRIQGRLLDWLKSHFLNHDVRPEVDNDEGRVDIVIFLKTPDEHKRMLVRNDWVLELKALNDKSSKEEAIGEAELKGRVKKGLTQVIAYKAALPSEFAALCCYDLRKEDIGDEKCFKEVAKAAKQNEIHLWRWYLHRNAESARNARYAA